MNDYIKKLLETAQLRETVIRDAINYLILPRGSKGFDAGCGIGLHWPMLIEAIGTEGYITGLDISTEFLEYAKKITDKSGLSKQISFQTGNASNLPFDKCHL
jgi:ubiquinone/menaquinone biosynthesis C-methylase UbiE